MNRLQEKFHLKNGFRLRAQVKIETRLDRLIKGNYGDCSPLHHGVSELRIDYGPGYRVYFGEMKNQLVIVLLLGGTKKTQRKDIDLAIQYWEDYKERYRYEHKNNEKIL